MRYTVYDYQRSWDNIGLLDKSLDPVALADKLETQIFGERDGDGARYWIPALYLLAGNIVEAERSIERHFKTYLNEYTLFAPEFITIALLVHVKKEKVMPVSGTGSKLLRRLMATNQYVIPLVLGTKIDNKNISDSSNHSHYEYAASFPDWFYGLWNDEDTKILSTMVNNVFNQSFAATWEKYRNELLNLRPGERRSLLIEERSYFLELMT